MESVLEKKKIVTFSNNVTINYMEEFIEEYSSVREPYWKIVARDRFRFQKRISVIGEMLKTILLLKYRKFRDMKPFSTSKYRL